MKKKVLFSLLSLMFLLVLVSGCGSSDQEKLDNVDKYIKEGNYSAAKAAKERNFDDKVNYYLAQSKYYTAQNKYGDALYELDYGASLKHTLGDDGVKKLNTLIDEILKERQSELMKTREKERESYSTFVSKLDEINKNMSQGFELYASNKITKSELSKLANESLESLPSGYDIKCDGATDEYRAASTYRSKMKKGIKKLVQSIKRGTNLFGYDRSVKKEVLYLEYMDEANSKKEKFEKLIKEEPKLY